ncbi:MULTISPECIES: flagellar hook-associated protein FlgK [unclassified Duganella]|uniref:flagellar hook-associated protein FlgK n=1 Tax=unclassified Duganella TaxID=2636909 RepID=UPI00088F1534|nr:MULTISPECIES: flagellar hook-associated protein FlgK [unclassified Duganella]SDG02499.1 flagellar hook-associated protein 1 FlgK [Duganella sp. OV458]SDJ02781.1 flagellar hook-associated protein 1 FlgK [Duganella sp. OV510]
MSLLSIGKSGLLAAQVGLSTTGNNITNANTAGYNRQVAIQGDTGTQYQGFGFVGTGTEIQAVRRYYDNFLATSLRNAEANQAALNTYSQQISQIDNLLADPTAGLSPALQDFFAGVQDATANPASVAARQSLLSNAESLAARFQGMSARLNEMQAGVNSTITSSVNEINAYAKQIADINNTIAGLTTSTAAPNDLLDKRDQMLTELNKLVKINVTQGDNNMLNVQFGTGQPLVVGNSAFQLTTANSPTDAGRVTIGYQTPSGSFSELPDSVFTGGQLGGILEFRNDALDKAQNALGQVAAGLATAFNAQHVLGQDQNDALGTNFFNPIEAYVGPSTRNSGASTAEVKAVITDASALTASDYSVDYDGTNFNVTRKSDGKVTQINPFPQTEPQVIDGVSYSISGTPAAKDNFLVRPTYNAAGSLTVAIKDPAKIALAAPVTTAAPTTNAGNGKITAGTVDQNYLTPGNALTAPVTLTFDKAAGTLSGFPADQDVTVTVNGTATVYPAGTPVPYTDGANISVGGVSFAISGTPADQDTFTVGPNTSGVGDSRNGALLAALQTKNVLNNGKATFQSTYAQMVNVVGTKARESQIAGTAADAAVKQATNSQQAVSGVNLDEEAANLLRYQQAYQASGKVMQVASQLFDTLLSLGN